MNIKKQNKNRSIIQMKPEEAKQFLLKPESYCSFDLPPYFDFSKIIKQLENYLKGKNINDLYNDQIKPKDCERVNHVLLNNKDGRHAWRSFEIIHPVLYCNLINTITEKGHWEYIINRFKEFREIENVHCMSIPVESIGKEKDVEAQILNWWSKIEQQSIELSLEYEIIIHTDITDCYGQIYTHSIAWALHGRREAKEKRNDRSLIGNIIDRNIQDMRFGQTNGIPQGSVLMDFIAEMVLGYSDLLLEEKLKKSNLNEYKILRYRDDYRIFVHNTSDGEKILKALTEVMIDLGLRINSNKTVISHEVIRSSIKADKLEWLFRKQSDSNLQRFLLIIHDHATHNPNSGSLLRALTEFRKRLDETKLCSDVRVLISIVVDIAFQNPRTYPICAAILSRLLSYIEKKREKEEVLKKIALKFSRLPNTGYMDIWLQRIAIPLNIHIEFNEPLCKIATGEKKALIWNNEWIGDSSLKKLMSTPILNKQKIGSVKEIIPADEVELFLKEFSL